MKRMLIDIARSGAMATVTTTGAALLAGKWEVNTPAAGLNATSHIVWGSPAFHVDHFDLAHTGVGALVNAAAMFSWASVMHALFPAPQSKTAAALVGSSVAALAYIFDYHVVPARLTPGFEHRLSKRALLGLYAALGATLAWGARRSQR